MAIPRRKNIVKIISCLSQTTAWRGSGLHHFSLLRLVGFSCCVAGCILVQFKRSLLNNSGMLSAPAPFCRTQLFNFNFAAFTFVLSCVWFNGLLIKNGEALSTILLSFIAQ